MSKSKVTLYTISHCPFCRATKRILQHYQNQVVIEEKNIIENPKYKAELDALIPEWKSAPQVLVDGNPLGGYVQISVLHDDGKLAAALSLGGDIIEPVSAELHCNTCNKILQKGWLNCPWCRATLELVT